MKLIMAALDDLILQIKDPELRERIQKEADSLLKQKKFGLVFEDHLPECTPLYDVPIKRRSQACIYCCKCIFDLEDCQIAIKRS